jgi:hypothetical protein
MEANGRPHWNGSRQVRDLNAVLAEHRKNTTCGLLSDQFQFYAFIGGKAFFGSDYQHGAIDSRRKSRFYTMPLRQRFLLSGDSKRGSPRKGFITMIKL